MVPSYGVQPCYDPVSRTTLLSHIVDHASKRNNEMCLVPVMFLKYPWHLVLQPDGILGDHIVYPIPMLQFRTRHVRVLTLFGSTLLHNTVYCSKQGLTDHNNTCFLFGGGGGVDLSAAIWRIHLNLNYVGYRGGYASFLPSIPPPPPTSRSVSDFERPPARNRGGGSDTFFFVNRRFPRHFYSAERDKLHWWMNSLKTRNCSVRAGRIPLLQRKWYDI